MDRRSFLAGSLAGHFNLRKAALALALSLFVASCRADTISQYQVTAGSGTPGSAVLTGPDVHLFIGDTRVWEYQRLLPGRDQKIYFDIDDLYIGPYGAAQLVVNGGTPSELWYSPSMQLYVEADLPAGLGSATTTTVESWGTGTLRLCSADWPAGEFCLSQPVPPAIVYNPETVLVTANWFEDPSRDFYYLKSYRWETIPEPGSILLFAFGLAILHQFRNGAASEATRGPVQ